MISSQESADGCASSHEFQHKQSFDRENPRNQQTPENVHTSLSEKSRHNTPMKTEAAAQESDAAVSTLQSHREGSKCSSLHEKTLQSRESSLVGLQSSVEGSFEKVPDDGYNWRKYGQKQVRGNEFRRSYYRCTSPNCPGKKQLERSHDGQITDTTYFGQHNHPKPHPDISTAVLFDVNIIEEKPNVPISKKGAQSEVEDRHTASRVSATDNVKGMHSECTRLLKDKTDGERGLGPKRRKKSNGSADPSPIEKLTGESRVVVQTRSEVDIVNDGYRWRKYGQKLVKGNANPRSYYRCSNPLCPVKKHVERASYDAKVVITTYEGQHNHDLPPSRTVTHNAGANTLTITNQAESGANSVSNAVDLSTSEIMNLARDVSSDKQLNGERKTCSEVNALAVHPAKDSETRHLELEQQNGKSETLKECDPVGSNGKVHSSTPNEHLSGGDEKTQSEKREDFHLTAQDSSGPERDEDKQATSAPNSLQS